MRAPPAGRPIAKGRLARPLEYAFDAARRKIDQPRSLAAFIRRANTQWNRSPAAFGEQDAPKRLSAPVGRRASFEG